ncbi:hypothetical protein K443DRAFT_8625 [Laccaria amethystina LaAM-08-1]|uniref:Uncharacterized protein n=1 Tax=Laccaria amethystina LaAM-08-1 TaxID=1095629 RepID=A0A0C9XTE4_9AGAR|nr:hypothetical protein K443DRAFT_8625 [Laccaria amethystina LaAM-08-1]
MFAVLLGHSKEFSGNPTKCISRELQLAAHTDESLALLGSCGKVLSGGTIGTGTAVATDDKHPFWDGDDITMEMVMDLDDWNVDESVMDMETALSSIMAVHTHKILSYKCQRS